LSRAKQKRFEEALRRLQAHEVTPKALEVFAQQWQRFWRCTANNGRPPMPQEVVECWAQVQSAPAQSAPGGQHRNSLAALDEEIRRRDALLAQRAK
jgi:hypothetical protein